MRMEKIIDLETFSSRIPSSLANFFLIIGLILVSINCECLDRFFPLVQRNILKHCDVEIFVA
jgi:hypothetical protein